MATLDDKVNIDLEISFRYSFHNEASYGCVLRAEVSYKCLEHRPAYQELINKIKK